MEKELNGTESENSVESGAANSNAEENKQTTPETGQSPEEVTEPESLTEKSEEASVSEEPSVDATLEEEPTVDPTPEEEPSVDSTPAEEPSVDPTPEEVPSSDLTPEVQEVVEVEGKVEQPAESDKEDESKVTDESDNQEPEGEVESAEVEPIEAKEEAVIEEPVIAQNDKNDRENSSDNKDQDPSKEDEAKGSTDEVEKANEVAGAHKPEEDEHHDDYADEDFTKYSKEDLVEVVKKLAKDENPLKADRILGVIAPIFNELRKKEKEEASSKFVADGGEAGDFSYKPGELDLRFDANYRLIKDRRSNFIKDREQEKQSNLAKAELVLDRLREFVDSEESTESFEAFKTLQNEWKAIGDVPSQQSKTLWANYNALIHRFYDQRSIYFELKELDRKKNYDAKVKLCERAEELDGVKEIREAIKQLNELHYDFKHLGPVPRDLQEDLWQRFKAASDKIYEKRKGFVAELKTELKENLTKKEVLAEEIQEFISFKSDQIKEWNSSSKKVLDIQKRWEAVGGLPKDKAKAVNKKFWSAFKTYFHSKKQFFKQLESEREDNLEIKQALVDKAEELKTSTDWIKTANEFKQLQNEWRETGPVPGKHRNEIYEKFKQACDEFFNNKRSQSKEAEGEYSANLKMKSDLIGKIESLAKKADFDQADLQKLCDEFHAIGFVPKKSIGKIKDGFREAVDKAIEVSTSIAEDQKETLAIKMIAGEALQGGDADRFIHQKEQNLRRQIGDLENNIALWTNNLEFFRNSKNADELRDDVNSKVEKAREELNQLKRRLKAFRKL